ncbi:MAG: hypothetical protein GC155_16365 [Alphaproteobacteria bacterium]|nr:hypothetical protein [Alphaproteobacteria bacterium]
MWKFLGGVALGVVLAFGYVKFNVELPGFLQLPGMLRGGLISSATEAQLYDLSADEATHQRALEVYFANQAHAAVQVDAEAGHRFLDALYAARARREAQELSMAWSAFDTALAKPALREALERKHGVTDDDALKRAMLFEQLDSKPFLKSWLARSGGALTPDTLRDRLTDAARGI